MKKLKKVLLSVVAMALVATLSVAGTLAYLQSETDPVENVFEANQVKVTLTEPADEKYSIVPGTSEAKTPKVTVTNTVDCYVYLQVTDATSPSGKKLVNYEIDTTNWTQLPGYSDVYYLTVPKAADPQEFFVLKGNTVSYPADITNADMLAADGVTLRNDIKLTFKAFAIQQTPFNAPALAYAAYSNPDIVIFKPSEDPTAPEKTLAGALEEGKPLALPDNHVETFTGTNNQTNVLNLGNNNDIDFCGNTLTVESASGKNGIKVEAGAEVTLAHGTVTQTKAYGSSYPVIDANRGTVTLDNMAVTLDQGADTNVSAGSDGGKVIIKDSTVDGPTSKYGNAVFCGSSSTVVFEGNSKVVGRINVMTSGIIEVYGGDFTEATWYYGGTLNRKNYDCTISGGTFAVDPSKCVGRIADGYQVVDNGNGTWTVVAATPAG